MHEMAREQLADKYFDELGLQFRASWDIYIKWYTVFLTANVVALGATVQYIDQSNRLIIVLAFSAQNILAFLTALYMSKFSRITARRMKELTIVLSDQETAVLLGPPPVPGDLASWSGYANAVGNLSLIACWIATLFVQAGTPSNG